MPISVECPACEHLFEIPSSYAGKKGKCPECGKIFVAPAEDDKRPRPPIAVVPPAPPLGEAPAAAIPPPRHVVDRSDLSAVSDPPPISREPPVRDTSISPPPRKARGKTHEAPALPGKPPAERPAGRSSHAGLWVAFGVLAAILVVSTVLLVKAVRLDGKQTMAEQENSSVDVQPEQTGDPSVDQKPDDPPVAKVDLNGIQREQLWQESKPSLYWIAAKRGEEVSRGLAFAINERGWLATSYQLVKDADSVELSAAAGDSSEAILSSGLIAANPHRNLALIEIPSSTKSNLNVVLDPLKVDDHLAVCRGDEAGKLSLVPSQFVRMTMLSDLSPNSRAAAREFGFDKAEGLIWLEHTQSIGALDDGGPLLNINGDVVGINMQLSGDNPTGFAFPSAYLLELLEEARDAPEPFKSASTEIASVEGPKFDPPTATAGDGPKPPPRAEPGTLESIDLIRELQAVCSDIQWNPASLGEYEVLQELAEHIHVAKQNENNPSIEEGLRILIAAAAQEVLVELSETAWPDDSKMASLNSYAIEGLASEGQGIVCYVTLAMTRGETYAVADTPTILCNLIGTEQAVVVPVNNDSRLLKKNSRWLLIGLHDPAHTFDVVAAGGEKVAPVIRAQILLGEPKDISNDSPSRRRGG